MTEFERYWQNCAPCGALGESLTVKCDRTTPRRFLVYCGDYKCAHSVIISAERWPDHVRLSDLEPKFTCKACGHRGADIRPPFERAKMGTEAG